MQEATSSRWLRYRLRSRLEYTLAATVWVVAVTAAFIAFQSVPVSDFLLVLVATQVALFAGVYYHLLDSSRLPAGTVAHHLATFALLFLAFVFAGGAWGLLTAGYSMEFLAGLVYGAQVGVPAVLGPTLLAAHHT
jgi:hypothetical protein